MNFYISDLHLNHKNVTKEGKDFDNRGFDTLKDMHECIEKKWNDKVTNGDTVYILGDCVWKLDKNIISMFARLKGKKILILGNHDNHSLKDRRFSILFDEIVSYKEITDNANGKNHNLVLSHYPIFSWNKCYKGSILLYGHTHTNFDDILYQESLKNLRCYIQNNNNDDQLNKNKPYAYNVGCMLPYINYEPRTIEEILKGGNIYYNGKIKGFNK